MHDIADFERRGIPGVFVASEQFVEAATAQSERLGFSPDRTFIAHPIQDRTNDELTELADGAVEALLAALTDSPKLD